MIVNLKYKKTGHWNIELYSLIDVMNYPFSLAWRLSKFDTLAIEEMKIARANYEIF